MGIKGLLKYLQPITQRCNAAEFRNQTAAIDAFCWLHKASYCCAQDLVLGNPTTKYVSYCMKLIDLLLHHGITPLVVFDGGRLPMKADENKERNRKRKLHEERGRSALRENDKAEAMKNFQQAVRITRDMVRVFAKALKQRKIQFIVAPYEADAQLAYLFKTGIADFLITEDSDLLAFGSRRVFFKMDRNGDGDYIDLDRVKSFRAPPKSTPETDFVVNCRRFSEENFLHTCILSGCDYLKSLPGMGLKTAQKYIKDHGMISRVFKWLRHARKKVPKSYEVAFRRADLTFKHQRVYDPLSKKIVHLTDLPESTKPLAIIKQEDDSESDKAAAGADEELDLVFNFLGPPISESLAEGLANSELDPNTLKPYPGGILTYVPNGFGRSYTPNPAPQRKSYKPKKKNAGATGFSFSQHRRKSTSSIPTSPPSPFKDKNSISRHSRSSQSTKRTRPVNTDLSSILGKYGYGKSTNVSSDAKGSAMPQNVSQKPPQKRQKLIHKSSTPWSEPAQKRKIKNEKEVDLSKMFSSPRRGLESSSSEPNSATRSGGGVHVSLFSSRTPTTLTSHYFSSPKEQPTSKENQSFAQNSSPSDISSNSNSPSTFCRNKTQTGKETNASTFIYPTSATSSKSSPTCSNGEAENERDTRTSPATDRLATDRHGEGDVKTDNSEATSPGQVCVPSDVTDCATPVMTASQFAFEYPKVEKENKQCQGLSGGGESGSNNDSAEEGVVSKHSSKTYGEIFSSSAGKKRKRSARNFLKPRKNKKLVRGQKKLSFGAVSKK